MVSVQPRPWPEPAPEIVSAVRAKYARRRAPLAVQIRDQLGEVFPDVEFEPGFGVRGRPGWSPGRLALVTVLQMAEDLTDRQAAEAVRERLLWQYALGLGLDDPGFDHSVLSEFRTRVVGHGLEERVLDLLLEAFQDPGAGRRRRQAAQRLHPCDLRGAGSEPPRAGRRVGARVSRGPRGDRAGLAGRHLRAR